MMRSLLATAVVLMVLALPVQAAGDAEGWGWLETIGRWFNLAVLFGGLAFLLRKPLAAFFDGQRRQIRQQLEDAREAQRRAEVQLAGVEEKLANLDAELAALREQAEFEAEREKERIREEAEVEAARLLETATREIEGLSRAAHHRLRAYASELAMKMATERARQELTSDADANLISRFLEELAEEVNKEVR